MSFKLVDVRVIVGLILTITIIVILLILTQPGAKAELKVLAPSKVETVPVHVANIQPYDRVTGNLRPRRVAALRFEVQGNIAERLVDPGQRVQRGALLLRLEQGDFQDVIADASAKLKEEEAAIRRDRSLLKLAKENHRLAKRQYERMEPLVKKSLVSVSKRDETRQKVLELRGEQMRLTYSVKTAKARLAMRHSAHNRALRDLQRTRLIAPFDGTVNRVMVQLGYHADASQVVLELIQCEKLDLYVEVVGSTAAGLQLGQLVDVEAGDRQLSGEVVALQLDPDPQTYTHSVQIRIPGDRLLPGMMARSHLPLRGHPKALVVPLSALTREDRMDYVFVVKGGRLERRRIEPGIRDGEYQVILSGLSEGEIVVSRDVASLSEGQTVALDVVTMKMQDKEAELRP